MSDQVRTAHRESLQAVAGWLVGSALGAHRPSHCVRPLIPCHHRFVPLMPRQNDARLTNSASRTLSSPLYFCPPMTSHFAALKLHCNQSINQSHSSPTTRGAGNTVLIKHTGSRNPVSRRTGAQVTMSPDDALSELRVGAVILPRKCFLSKRLAPGIRGQDQGRGSSRSIP